MNKALILLLVTLVQSQSDGILLPNPSTKDGFQDSQLEERDGSETSYPTQEIRNFEDNQQLYRKRSVTSDAFTRRSALDKNFMRFGRGGGATRQHCGKIRSDGKVSFYRFSRGLKDNFIRFGRGQENFIRFGRGRPEDFYRAGKSLRENFIRFGKADKNFLRFGRENTDQDYRDFISLKEPFQRSEKSSNTQGNFRRFGKNGKNGTNFLRFGKSDIETDVDERNQDSETTKGEVKRKRRDAREKPPGKNFKIESKRRAAFFGAPPVDFSRRLSPANDGLWQNLENLRNSRLTPFFPVFSTFPKSLNLYGAESKRDQRGSNFIRFG